MASVDLQAKRQRWPSERHVQAVLPSAPVTSSCQTAGGIRLAST